MKDYFNNTCTRLHNNANKNVALSLLKSFSSTVKQFTSFNLSNKAELRKY